MHNSIVISKKAKSLVPVTKEAVKHISEFTEHLKEMLINDARKESMKEYCCK